MPKYRKWVGIVALAISLAFIGVVTHAQQPPKTVKIGEMLFRDRTDLGAGRQVFRGQLRELGYIEGKNIIYETRSAKGKLEQFPALAEELVRRARRLLNG